MAGSSKGGVSRRREGPSVGKTWVLNQPLNNGGRPLWNDSMWVLTCTGAGR